MSNVYASNHPLVAHKLSRLRDKKTEPKKFRELVREIAALLAYEATMDLAVTPREFETPLAKMTGAELQQKIGLVPILRAGDEHTLKPVEYYNKLPIEPRVSVCMILDPMLATGGSATATADILKRWGVKRIKFVGLIAAPEGIKVMQTAHPDIDIHIAAIDDHLNERAYIVPGLGDAGDRQFGTG